MCAKPNAPEKVYFISLGCPKNRVDTEIMAGSITAEGMIVTADSAEADVIVVNTCSFIGDAKEESVNALLEMAEIKKNGRCRLLVAAGCLPQRNGNELAEAMPEIDLLVSTTAPNQLGQAILGARIHAPLNTPGHFLQTTATPRFIEPGTISAYIKIADGCSRKCAFCAIPGIRGKGESRSMSDIVHEAAQLAEKGVVELMLMTQDTVAYGRDRDDGANLPALLVALNNVPGIRWIRLLYLYPDAITDELLYTIRDTEKVLPYLDIPIQHASGPMLKRMRRGHGPGDLTTLFARIGAILPNAWLRTTVLVGHPGETDADVDALVRFIEKTGFHHLGAFRYSDEEGTASYMKQPAVSRKDSYNRWRRVMAAQRRVVMQKNRCLPGKMIHVLVEEPADDAGLVLVGRHAGQAPEIDGLTYLTSCSASRGEIVEAIIQKARVHDLVAAPVGKSLDD